MRVTIRSRAACQCLPGDRLDYWVTGMGTGGTPQGVARVLKKKSPETRIIVCEPDGFSFGNGCSDGRTETGLFGSPRAKTVRTPTEFLS